MKITLDIPDGIRIGQLTVSVLLNRFARKEHRA